MVLAAGGDVERDCRKRDEEKFATASVYFLSWFKRARCHASAGLPKRLTEWHSHGRS